jgi:20S proteasome alpha/beta subunit
MRWPLIPKQRPLTEAPVTIAAGFRYKNGLLLCADTQYTGQIKFRGSKILAKSYDDGSKSAFVIVGNPRYARMCVNVVEDTIESLDNPDRSLSKMQSIVIAGVKEIHQGHIFKHPRREEITVQFLIGLWSARTKGDVAFLSTEDTSVIRVYGYDCLGSGEMLAQQFIRPKYHRITDITKRPLHSESEVRQLAIDALKEVKKYDAFCGYDSEYLTITNDGDMSPIRKLTIRQSTSRR